MWNPTARLLDRQSTAAIQNSLARRRAVWFLPGCGGLPLENPVEGSDMVSRPAVQKTPIRECSVFFSFLKLLEVPS